MEKEDKYDVKKLFTNSYAGTFISWFSFITFIISNFFIFYLFASFFEFNLNQDILYFIIGFFISCVLLKTGYFIETFEQKKEEDKKDFIKQLRRSKVHIGLGYQNVIVISAKLFFFNILNDFFIVLIFWSSFFGIAFIFSLISITQSNFQNLVNILTVIGILSGLFQFYITNYKEEISKKIGNSVAQYFVRISKKITFNDFLEYAKRQDKGFSGKLEDEVHKSPAFPLLKSFKAMRAGQNVTNITMNVGAQNDMVLSEALDFAEGIDKTKLNKLYKDFFVEKDKDLKKYIGQMNISELQKTLLPNIVFFEEVITQLIKTNHEVGLDEDKEPENYQEHLTQVLQENIFYLIKRILNIQDSEDKNEREEDKK